MIRKSTDNFVRMPGMNIYTQVTSTSYSAWTTVLDLNGYAGEFYLYYYYYDGYLYGAWTPIPDLRLTIDGTAFLSSVNTVPMNILTNKRMPYSQSLKVEVRSGFWDFGSTVYTDIAVTMTAYLMYSKNLV